MKAELKNVSAKVSNDAKNKHSFEVSRLDYVESNLRNVQNRLDTLETSNEICEIREDLKILKNEMKSNKRKIDKINSEDNDI